MGHKILLTDDDTSVLKLLTIGLKKAGYTVIAAENGLDGFNKAQEEQPDLIVSDVVMPEMDGINFCRKVREESSIPMVPFIFMSSLNDPTNEIRGFRAGADEYLSKPVDRNVLVDKVKELLDRQEKNVHIKDKVSQEAAFSGKLENLSIGEIIQLLNLNLRNGTLIITDDHDSKEGSICMQKGQMTYAKCVDLVSEEAVYEIVKILHGTFEFISDKMEEETNIHNSTMNVLMEALRLMDEDSKT